MEVNITNLLGRARLAMSSPVIAAQQQSVSNPQQRATLRSYLHLFILACRGKDYNTLLLDRACTPEPINQSLFSLSQEDMNEIVIIL